MIAHMVYFSVNDNTPVGRQKVVDICKKYLDGHDGVVYFSAGMRAEAFNRDVNAKDWDVALHLVFTDKAAHDRYQVHPRHEQFVKEGKALWHKVQVFDAEVA